MYIQGESLITYLILSYLIVIYKHDSRIDPGNRYKDICRGTSVTTSLPGQ